MASELFGAQNIPFSRGCMSKSLRRIIDSVCGYRDIETTTSGYLRDICLGKGLSLRIITASRPYTTGMSTSGSRSKNKDKSTNAAKIINNLPQHQHVQNSYKAHQSSYLGVAVGAPSVGASIQQLNSRLVHDNLNINPLPQPPIAKTKKKKRGKSQISKTISTDTPFPTEIEREHQASNAPTTHPTFVSDNSSYLVPSSSGVIHFDNSQGPVPSASGVFHLHDRAPTSDSESAPPQTIPIVPKPEYLATSSLPPHRRPRPNPKLLILDLNGTLLFRPRNHNVNRTIDMRASSVKPVLRPYLREFTTYIFEHFHVMFWSSATPRNVQAMINAVTTEAQRQLIIASWARDTLGLTPEEYNRKSPCVKDLEKVFRNRVIRKRGIVWNESNTILIDDSFAKAALQPFNHIYIPEFLGDVEADNVLYQIISYLEGLRYQGHVARFIRESPFRAHQGDVDLHSMEWNK